LQVRYYEDKKLAVKRTHWDNPNRADADAHDWSHTACHAHVACWQTYDDGGEMISVQRRESIAI